TLDESATLIEQKTSVKIAIPGDAEIRAVLGDSLHGRLAVLLEHGVGHAIRKAAIGFMMNLDEFEGQMRLEPVDNEPWPTVAGVDDDLQGLERCQVNVGQQMFNIGVGRTDAVPGADTCRLGELAA